MINRNKIVIFGAGKIGRSFIGQLFNVGGYEVVFIDQYKPIIDELNYRRNYNVIIKSAQERIVNISNVRGVYTGDEEKVVYEMATAGILAVAVGQNGLNTIFPLLAKGLIERYKNENNYSLDIIIAENMRNANIYFHDELSNLLPEDYKIDDHVGLVETSIGKMVPIMPKEDIRDNMMQIYAEPYNTLIVDELAFINPIPDIQGLAPKKNIKAWVDRKLFIHNLGHAATAYIGFLYNPNFTFIHEVLEVPEIFDSVLATMLQSANILLKKYPEEFTIEELEDHINDLLFRFRNKALGDTIFRVGCDLARKLGKEDRLAGAIKTALDVSLSYDKILYALICGCHFKARDQEGNLLVEDVAFFNSYKRNVRLILEKISGFGESLNPQLFQSAEEINNQIISKYRPEY